MFIILFEKKSPSHVSQKDKLFLNYYVKNICGVKKGNGVEINI